MVQGNITISTSAIPPFEIIPHDKRGRHSHDLCGFRHVSWYSPYCPNVECQSKSSQLWEHTHKHTHTHTSHSPKGLMLYQHTQRSITTTVPRLNCWDFIRKLALSSMQYRYDNSNLNTYTGTGMSWIPVPGTSSRVFKLLSEAYILPLE